MRKQTGWRVLSALSFGAALLFWGGALAKTITLTCGDAGHDGGRRYIIDTSASTFTLRVPGAGNIVLSRVEITDGMFTGTNDVPGIYRTTFLIDRRSGELKSSDFLYANGHSQYSSQLCRKVDDQAS